MPDKKFPQVAYDMPRLAEEELLARSNSYYQEINERRSIREFSSDPIPKKVIEDILMAASSAPSGAHKQPWTFCVISDPEIKKKIREAAEKEEYENYTRRMSKRWLDDLMPFDTTWQKPFLEEAPYLIIVFKQVHGLDADGKQVQHYYVNESVGIATGFLLSAIHQSGLSSLTHTPSPMNFLHEILERPANERAFMLLPIGYPELGATVPDLGRKTLEEVSQFY